MFHPNRRFVRIITLTALSVWFAFGQPAGPVEHPPTQAAAQAPQAVSSWKAALWRWPVVRFLASLFDMGPASTPGASGAGSAFAAAGSSAAACSVPPLEPIADPAARQLEAVISPEGAIDVNGMAPAAARALNLFQSKVAAAGGSLELKSAYRPAAYQKHLQDVWYKWMDLRNNHDPGCQALRAQVQEEFARHRLIETQHPVTVSDHTRGLAFDATVSLPPHPRIAGRRFSLDSLARLAGLLRPAIAADPVHFKYIGATRVAFAGSLRKVRATHAASVRRSRNTRLA